MTTAPENPGPSDQPRTIALLAATTTELLPTVRRLNLQRHGHRFLGQQQSVRVVAEVTGIGPTSAAAALIRLLDAEKVASIIHLGFAGGLERGLRAGELLDIRWLISSDGSILWIDEGVPAVATNTSERTPQRTLLTADRMVASVVAKRRLYEQHLAASVDMESFQLAKLASQLQIAYRAVRAVSDPWDMALPPETQRWVKPSGQPDLAAVLKDLAKRPSLLAAVLALRKHARLAADAVARRTAEVLSQEIHAVRRLMNR